MFGFGVKGLIRVQNVTLEFDSFLVQPSRHQRSSSENDRVEWNQ